MSSDKTITMQSPGMEAAPQEPRPAAGIKLRALQAGVKPQVLTRYITARVTDKILERRMEAEQLEMLFSDGGHR
jgi:hypothetical protein